MRKLIIGIFININLFPFNLYAQSCEYLSSIVKQSDVSGKYDLVLEYASIAFRQAESEYGKNCPSPQTRLKKGDSKIGEWNL